MHNRVGGDTCFLDAIVGFKGVIRSPFDGNASSQWQQLADIKANDPNGQCFECHANDPFLVTDYVLEGTESLSYSRRRV